MPSPGPSFIFGHMCGWVGGWDGDVGAWRGAAHLCTTVDGMIETNQSIYPMLSKREMNHLPYPYPTYLSSSSDAATSSK